MLNMLQNEAIETCTLEASKIFYYEVFTTEIIQKKGEILAYNFLTIKKLEISFFK